MVETRRNTLFRLLQNINELPSLLGVPTGEEAVGSASVLGTGCSADSVHIVLSIIGEVEIDHVFYVAHICGKETIPLLPGLLFQREHCRYESLVTHHTQTACRSRAKEDTRDTEAHTLTHLPSRQGAELACMQLMLAERKDGDNTGPGNLR